MNATHDSGFKEDFQLVLVTGYPESIVDANDETFRAEFLSEIRGLVARSLPPDAIVETAPTSYGYGADTLALTLMISGLAGVFLSGKRINENITAWIDLGKRFGNLLRSMEARFGRPLVSEPIAFALAIAAIADKDTN